MADSTSPIAETSTSAAAATAGAEASTSFTSAHPPPPPPPPPRSPPILLDLRNLDYVFATDPNLLCPICHSPLVNPVQTKCLHTFCSTCISTSLEQSSSCPVDRKPLVRDDITPAPIMITNLVNDLIVLCPNAEKGCGLTFSRCLMEGHLKEDCGYQMVRCRSNDDPECNEPVMRKDNGRDKGCMHRPAECKHCSEKFRLMDLPAHEDECPSISTTCEHCGGEYARSDIRDHISACPSVIEACPAAVHGCTHTSMRSDMPPHASACSFVQLSPLLQAHADRIGRLELENRSVRKKLEVLLRGARSDSSAAVDIETQTYHLFAEQEHLRQDVDRISARVADMDVKQAMLLMNENIRYNEEMAGMRLAINALRMQINFLAASRSTMASPGPGPSGASGGAGASGGSAGAGPPSERRLSGIKL